MLTIQIFVEAAVNIAVQGTFRPRQSLWEQLKGARHRRCLRTLIETRSLPKWRQLLSRNIDTARLLAKCLLEQIDGPVEQQN